MQTLSKEFRSVIEEVVQLKISSTEDGLNHSLGDGDNQDDDDETFKHLLETRGGSVDKINNDDDDDDLEHWLETREDSVNNINFDEEEDEDNDETLEHRVESLDDKVNKINKCSYDEKTGELVRVKNSQTAQQEEIDKLRQQNNVLADKIKNFAAIREA